MTLLSNTAIDGLVRDHLSQFPPTTEHQARLVAFQIRQVQQAQISGPDVARALRRLGFVCSNGMWARA